MTNGEMFERIFGLEFNFPISCEEISCYKCPYKDKNGCDTYDDLERGIDWANMEMR